MPERLLEHLLLISKVRLCCFTVLVANSSQKGTAVGATVDNTTKRTRLPILNEQNQRLTRPPTAASCCRNGQVWYLSLPGWFFPRIEFITPTIRKDMIVRFNQGYNVMIMAMDTSYTPNTQWNHGAKNLSTRFGLPMKVMNCFRG